MHIIVIKPMSVNQLCMYMYVYAQTMTIEALPRQKAAFMVTFKLHYEKESTEILSFD